MKRKLTVILLAAALCLVLICMAACNPLLSDISKAQKNAVQNAVTFNCTATVADQGVTVYVYSKTLTVMSDSMSVTTAESILNSSFVLEEKSVSEELQPDRSLIKTADLSAKNVAEATEAEGGVSCKVTADKLSAVLGTEITAEGDAQVFAAMQDGVLNSVTVTFTTQGKTVTLEYKYSY